MSRRTRITRARALLPLLLFAAVLLTGCDSSPTIEVGAIRVTVTTIGNNFDPDGYTIQVTGEGDVQSQAVDVNGEVAFAVSAGRHIVELLDKAPNCVTDLNPQLANVAPGETVRLEFNNLCG